MHPWVNTEAFLSKCLVGYLVPDDFDAATVGARQPPKPNKQPSSSSGASSLAAPSAGFKAPRLPGNNKAKPDANVKTAPNRTDRSTTAATVTPPDVTMADADSASVVLVVPALPQRPAGPMKPTWDWYQSSKEVVL